METKSYTYYSHKLGKEVSVDLNKNHLDALIERHVEGMVKQMEKEDLVQYVTDDMYQHLESLTYEEVIDACVEYWDDMFDDVVEEIKFGNKQLAEGYKREMLDRQKVYDYKGKSKYETTYKIKKIGWETFL